jgi:DNA polymerase I
MSKEKLVVIDGHALIHRAYHAIPPLTTKDGQVVNAVYGFAVILLNVIRDLKPKYIAVAFDLPGKTKRHDDYAEYKATRKAAPDDLKSQIGLVRNLVETFNIPVLDKPGYEADDVIGTIVKNSPKEVENYIVTGDLDELQLVDQRTKVYTMKRGFSDIVIYDETKVVERYQLTPDQFVDYKALRGDPSDNIPGVAGIGEKTATDLIKEFGSLENVYKNLDDIKPAIAKKLSENKDMAYLSQKLATIKTDLSLDFDLEKCVFLDFDQEKVLGLFQELGFKSLVSKIPEGNHVSKIAPSNKHLKKVNYQLVQTEKDLKEIVSKFKKSKAFAIDTETNSRDQIEAKLVGISLSNNPEKAYYIPIRHTVGSQIKIIEIIEILRPLLEDKEILKIGHNIKYDYVVLLKEGLKMSGPFFDTMIAAFLTDPNLRAQKLSALAFAELGLKMTEITDYIGSGKNQLTFDQVPIKDALIYAAEDADITYRLYQFLTKELQKKDLLKLAEEIEFPLIPILGKMELSGIKVDQDSLRSLSKKTKEKLKTLEAEIYKIAGEEFNIASPSQLQTIIFDKLKIHQKMKDPKDLKKLKNGGFSTAASELEKLRGTHPVVKKIFEFRELSKLLNTYIDVLPNLVKKDKRIHTSYNQAIAQTGRLSSSDPNLQNIPTRTTEGKKIKASFVADSGTLLLSADYSQIELRVIAHIANDQNMIEVFKSNRDIHTETAAGLYEVTEKKVTPEMRRAAKIVNFGIIYGVSAHGLHQQVGVSREEGQRLIDKYFSLHPNVRSYSDKMIAQAKELGYVETIFGRRRWLPEINSKNFIVRGAAERMAINMPIQGTAADLMKLAMIDIAGQLPALSPASKLLLQVHDELILEVPEKDIEKVANFVKEKMNNVAHLSVPIETEVHWGKNWGELK